MEKQKHWVWEKASEVASTVHARDTEKNKAQKRAVASRMAWKSQSQKILIKGIQKTLEDGM